MAKRTYARDRKADSGGRGNKIARAGRIRKLRATDDTQLARAAVDPDDCAGENDAAEIPCSCPTAPATDVRGDTADTRTDHTVGCRALTALA